MVKDFRFSRVHLGDAENARLDKAIAAIQTASLISPGSTTRKTQNKLTRLLRYASREIAGQLVPCDSSDLEIITSAGRLPPDVYEESQDSSRIVIEVFSEESINYLKKHPEHVRSLPGKIFEDLIAEILAWLGFEDISLRVQTELGEVDIFGFTRDLMGGRIAYIFELKQLGNSMRPVKLKEITRLYGLREGLRQRLGITQGVFVTTTDYTTRAKEAGEIHHLSLNTYEDLLRWLKEYEISPNGLHLKADT